MNGHLVLQVALREEARQVLTAGSWRRNGSAAATPALYEGRIGRREAVLAVSGVGRVCAEAAVDEVLRRYHASAILSLGFSGGLLSGQRAGDLIVAHTTMSMPIQCTRRKLGGPQSSDNNRPESDLTLNADAIRVLERMGLRYRCGVCVTASDVVSNPDSKRQIGCATGALAVDMESFWVGLACRERGVPFLTVRSIVDVMEHPIPPWVSRFPSGVRGRTLLREIPHLMHPRSILALVRLARAASVARSSLTAFVVEFLNSRARIDGGMDRLPSRSAL